MHSMIRGNTLETLRRNSAQLPQVPGLGVNVFILHPYMHDLYEPYTHSDVYSAHFHVCEK